MERINNYPRPKPAPLFDALVPAPPAQMPNVAAVATPQQIAASNCILNCFYAADEVPKLKRLPAPEDEALVAAMRYDGFTKNRYLRDNPKCE